jgi:NAD(P)H dehydrogenase (quinone)
MLLVAGGTGLVARPIIGGLAQTPGGKRLLTEDALTRSIPTQFEVHQASFYDKPALARALDGVREMFLIPRIDQDLIAKQRALIVAAILAGVKEITLLSLIGADSRSPVRILRWFGVVEDEVRAHGFNTTILRTAPFMQNLLLFARSAMKNGELRAPFREVKFPWLSACDLAAVAAALSDDNTGNEILTLSGPEALGFADFARLVCQATNRELEYVDITMHEARGYLEAARVSPMKVLAISEWWDALISGVVEIPVSDDLERLLGRKPISLAQFVAENLGTFSACCRDSTKKTSFA